MTPGWGDSVRKLLVVTVDLLGGDSKSIAVEVHTERPVPDGAVELVGIDDTGVYRGIHALGELRENGKVIGTVASRRNTTRGGYGACGKIHVSTKKVAEDLAEWMKAPSMDATQRIAPPKNIADVI